MPVLKSADCGNRLIASERGGHKYAMACQCREFSIFEISPVVFVIVSTMVDMATSRRRNAFRIIGVLWGESTRNRWIPLTKGPVMQSFSASLLFLNKLLKISEAMTLMRRHSNLPCEIFLCATYVLCSMSVHHYNGVIMGTIASQITSLTSVYSVVYWDADQRKPQSSASLAFVRGIHRGPVNSPHKWLRGNVSIWWRHHA